VVVLPQNKNYIYTVLLWDFLVFSCAFLSGAWSDRPFLKQSAPIKTTASTVSAATVDTIGV
jgi:hypothetical protein